MDGILMRKMIQLLLSAFLVVAGVASASAQFTDQRNWGGTSSGSANAQTLTIANFPAGPPTGVPIRGLAGFTNTNATTLTISGGSGAKNVFKPSATGAVALTGGEIVAGQLFEVVYDGTQYQLTSNNAQAAAFRTPPQGYLTPCNFANSPAVTGCIAGSPTPTGDVTSVAVLYYGTWFGNQLPIYNGVSMAVTTFTELTLTIPSSRLANTIYDVLIINDAGTIRACFGPAWTTSTAGAGARGTGAATAEITQVQGTWVNAVSISCVNGASTYSVAVNQGTVVGTVLIDGTNGQVSFTRTYGQSRRWAAWNFYNRLPITLRAGDPNGSWNYGTATVRPSNGSAANSLITLTGLPQELIDVGSSQQIGVGVNTAVPAHSGVGWNSTTVISGLTTGMDNTTSSGAITAFVAPSLGRYQPTPGIGSNVATMLETPGDATNRTFYGTEAFMLLIAQYRG